jgi:hypothetical protein
MPNTKHYKITYGQCPVCRHYGEDCTGKPLTGLENDLKVLDLVARVLRCSQAGQRYKVHRRAANDEFFAVELRDGRLFNVTIQEVDLGKL